MFDARGVKRWLVAAGIVVALGAASPALAATKIGETFAPPNDCTADTTNLQSASPSDSYAAPSAGVITSWSFLAPATVPPAQEIKFKVGNLVSGDNFQITASSGPGVRPAASTLNNYDIRVPVEQGDVIGLYLKVAMACGTNPAPGYDYHHLLGDIGLVPAQTWTQGFQVKYDISAQLEPDADGDGFGDETQDQCPTDASTQGQCPGPPNPPAVPDTDAPETTITKDAPKKTDKHKVKFAFKSDEHGSTFECQLDKQAFKACSSPIKLKHLDQGKHKFKVWAIDPAGNADLSAAQDKFKVVD